MINKTTFNNSLTAYLGIDPGLLGGFALFFSDGRIRTLPMPTLKIKQKNGKTRRVLDHKTILHFLNNLPAFSCCCIERQIAARNQHIVSSFTIAFNYGLLIMALTASHTAFKEIPSKDWQDYFGITPHRKGQPGPTTKEQAAVIAKQLFPDADLKETPRSHKPHEGVVDSLLIAEYGRREIWVG